MLGGEGNGSLFKDLLEDRFFMLLSQREVGLLRLRVAEDIASVKPLLGKSNVLDIG